MTDHIHIDDLSAYLDDELSRPEAAHVAKHLTSCPECRGQLESLSWTVSYVLAAPRAPAPPPGAFHVATGGGLGARLGPRIGPWRRRQGPLTAWAMASMAVAVVVLTFALTRLTEGLPGIHPQADSSLTAALQDGAPALSEGEAAIPPPVTGGGTEGRGLRERPEGMALRDAPEPGAAAALDQAAAPGQADVPERAAAAATTPAETAPDKGPPPGEGTGPWRGLLVAAILLLDVVALAVLLRGRRG